MIRSLWRNDRTFQKALLAQTGFPVFASLSHMDDRMANRKLNSLAFPGLII